MSKKYDICLEWPQFEEYFLEDYTLKTVKKYKECYNECYELPGQVCINYWYGDYENGKSNIFWTFSGHEEKIHNLKYTSSSCFAMYWSSLTDDIEEDEEAEYVDEPCSGDEDDYDYHECTDHKCRYKGHWHKKSTKKDEDDEEHCPYCHDKKEVDCPYCHTKLSPK